MDIFLKFLGVIGILVLVIILVVVIAVVIVIGRFKKALKTAQLAVGTPSRIHVKSAPDAAWSDVDQRKAAEATVTSYGFSDLGYFTIAEMPGVLLQAFVKPQDGSIAVVYEHPRAGQWIDFVVRYEDGTSLTVSNAKMGHEMDHRPGQEKIYRAGAPTDELWQVVRENRLTEPFKSIGTVDAFIEMFEKAYNDEMDWRNARGGPTADEIRRVAERAGINASETAFEIQETLSHVQANRGLAIALMERLRAKKTIPEEELDGIASMIIFVHDNLDMDDVRGWFPESEQDENEAQTTSVREAFAIWNAKLSLAQQYIKLDQLQEPVEADVYRAPVVAAIDA